MITTVAFGMALINAYYILRCHHEWHFEENPAIRLLIKATAERHEIKGILWIAIAMFHVILK